MCLRLDSNFGFFYKNHSKWDHEFQMTNKHYINWSEKIWSVCINIPGETVTFHFVNSCRLSQWSRKVPPLAVPSRYCYIWGHAMAQLVGALRYKPEGCRFDWRNLSGRTMDLESTQPLTEMSTTNISLGVKAAGAYGWQPDHLYVLIVLKSGSFKPLEPSGLVIGV
jgi:hypothetical protein